MAVLVTNFSIIVLLNIVNILFDTKKVTLIVVICFPNPMGWA
jgi:hypothetical protein